MTQIEGVTLASRSDWTVLRPLLFESIGKPWKWCSSP